LKLYQKIIKIQAIRKPTPVV